MKKLVINGGKVLKGSVEINGAKNAAVAILPAAILASEGKCVIENIPDIEDVHCLDRILKSLGCSVSKIDNNTWNWCYRCNKDKCMYWWCKKNESFLLFYRCLIIKV